MEQTSIELIRDHETPNTDIKEEPKTEEKQPEICLNVLKPCFSSLIEDNRETNLLYKRREKFLENCLCTLESMLVNVKNVNEVNTIFEKHSSISLALLKLKTYQF